MKVKDFSNIKINYSDSLHKALEKMTNSNHKLLIVLKESKYYSLLSIGDIQRSILKGESLNVQVEKALRKNVKIAYDYDDEHVIKNMMLNNKMEFCPVINSNSEIVNIFFWEDLFDKKITHNKSSFDLPVVVMAGGYGTRLRPLTYVIPKPLVPIGEKTMLEEIFERFSIYGSANFYLSVNYKSELIKFYLQHNNLPYQIEYFEEETPLGTAGSLTLLKGKIDTTFFVTNCDILIEEDYSEILDFHRKNYNVITVVAAIKQMTIPYGIMNIGENGELLSIEEKPSFNFIVNTGFYILEPEIFDFIPENQIFDLPTLIEEIKKNQRKVGVFPVAENSWTDMGDWAEYSGILKKKGFNLS